MYVNEHLKLNKIVECKTAKPREMYFQFGGKNATNANFSGEEMVKDSRKIDKIAQSIEDYEKFAEEEANK